MECPSYLNHRNRVNTILRFGESSSERRGFDEDAGTCTLSRVRSPETSATLNGSGPCLTDISAAGYNRSPVTDHKKTLGSVKSMAAAEAWDAALAMAPLWVLGSVAAWLLEWRSLSE